MDADPMLVVFSVFTVLVGLAAWFFEHTVGDIHKDDTDIPYWSQRMRHTKPFGPKSSNYTIRWKMVLLTAVAYTGPPWAIYLFVNI